MAERNRKYLLHILIFFMQAGLVCTIFRYLSGGSEGLYATKFGSF